MKITRTNYANEIPKVDFNKLQGSDTLSEGHNFVVKFAGGGKDWTMYDQSTAVKESIDIYLEKLNKAIEATGKKKPTVPRIEAADFVKKPTAKEKLEARLSALSNAELITRFNGSTSGDKERPVIKTLLTQRFKQVDVPFRMMVTKGKIFFETAEEAKKAGAPKAIIDELKTKGRPNDAIEIHSGRKLTPEPKAEPPVITFKKTKINFDRSKGMTAEPVKEKKSTPKAKKPATTNAKKTTAPKAKKPATPTPKKEVRIPENITEFSPEIQVMQMYSALDGKTVSASKILSIINKIQTYIDRKEIRLKSHFAGEILIIQDKLVDLWNRSLYRVPLTTKVPIECEPKFLTEILAILEAAQQAASVHLVLAYRRMQGKDVPVHQAQSLLDKFKAVRDAKLIGKDDHKVIDSIQKDLVRFINAKEKAAIRPLMIKEATLAGINSLLGRCGCREQHSGLGLVTPFTAQAYNPLEVQISSTLANDNVNMSNQPPEGRVIPTTEVNLPPQNPINLPPKFRSLMGRVVEGFVALIWGPRGSGKSTLALRIAHWLAKNHGTVLYTSFEEGFDKTSFMRMDRLNLRHPDLHWADHLPDNLEAYDTIIIDSITHAKLDIDFLKSLRAYVQSQEEEPHPDQPGNPGQRKPGRCPNPAPRRY